MDVNATVSISIQSVNDIPLASNMTYSAPEDSDFTVFFGCSDVDLNDRSTVVIKGVPPPEAGVLYQADQQYRAVLDRNGRIYENDTVIGSAVYVPLKNYFGSFNVPYSCVDSSQAESADATITVNVLNINDPPVAKDISIRIDEDSVAEFLLDPTDVESPFESLSVIILDLPQQGLLFIESTSNVTNTTWLPIKTAPFGPTFVKKLKFIPTTNSFGISVFHYLTQDGTDVSVYNGTVVISVEPINDPPTLILPGNAMEFFEDTETVIQFTVVDVDEGQPLVKVSNIHINGSLFHVGVHSSSKTELLIGEGSEISGPPYRVLFIPQPNYFTNSGIEGVPQNFEVQLTDFSSNTSISHTFQFDIRPVNDPPKLTCGTIELPQRQITEATAVHTFEIVADDPDNQNLTYFLASVPKRGFLVDHDNRVLSANDAFTSRQLVFSSNGTGGGYPYANFSVYVIDEHGSQSNLCMFHFIFSCPARTYNNIFLSGGPICTTCPDGASCNSDGREMPIANPGYWKSYENNTAFLPCIPKEACSGDGAALAECARGYTGTSIYCFIHATGSFY
ncbi:hypothetical protein BKA69DRAFT_1080743 [Paraphysoderma sedebokerense]|nr:hypothetical protein BKA69DRAFT_1080743 [Paraphysoderma sedebokerense]